MFLLSTCLHLLCGLTLFLLLTSSWATVKLRKKEKKERLIFLSLGSRQAGMNTTFATRRHWQLLAFVLFCFPLCLCECFPCLPWPLLPTKTAVSRRQLRVWVRACVPVVLVKTAVCMSLSRSYVGVQGRAPGLEGALVWSPPHVVMSGRSPVRMCGTWVKE